VAAWAVEVAPGCYDVAFLHVDNALAAFTQNHFLFNLCPLRLIGELIEDY